MSMKTTLLLLLWGFSMSLLAQELYIYPQKGQTQEQQEKDKYECYQWAKQNTGVDPVQGTPPPPSSSADGSVARGALRGAVGGLVVGNVAGGSGSKGAAAGALIGGTGSAIRKGQQQSAQQQSTAAAQADYNRAYGACLEGRGYTVK